MWDSRIREYENLVRQTENLDSKVPHSCKVCIVRSMTPKELEKDPLRVDPSANYQVTKGYM